MKTHLPFMNWTAGNCATVINEIEDQWKTLDINFKKSVSVQVRDLQKDGAHITADILSDHKKFQIVLVTVGFGEESKFGLKQRSYWSRRALASTS